MKNDCATGGPPYSSPTGELPDRYMRGTLHCQGGTYGYHGVYQIRCLHVDPTGASYFLPTARRDGRPKAVFIYFDEHF
jgi:hypothetical protein